MNHLEILRDKIIKNEDFQFSCSFRYTHMKQKSLTKETKHLFEKWKIVDEFKKNASQKIMKI